MKDLGTLGGPTSGATGINKAGQVVGWSDVAGGGSHAFLYSGGKMTDLGDLGGNYSYATAVNNFGQVVGNSLTAGGTVDPFLYSGGKMIDLNSLLPPGSKVTFTSADAINDFGQILARGPDGNAFLFQGPNLAPEPASLTLLALGGAVVAGCAWRRRRGRRSRESTGGGVPLGKRHRT
jgi:probable HAF family extracellular repeat protein